MSDLLLHYLGSVVVTAILLLVVLATLFELRRRTRDLAEQAARYPDACRLPTLQDEVQQLTDSRAALRTEVEEAKLLILRRSVAETWLEANYITYEKANRELPALLAQIELAVARRDTCRVECHEAEAECNAIRVEQQEIRRTIAPLRKLLEQQRETEKWLAVNLPIHNRLQQELPQLSADAAGMHQQLQSDRNELIEIVSKRQRAASERDWLLAENSRLNRLIHDQTAEHHLLEKEFGEIQARHAGMLVELEQLRARRDAAESDFIAIESQIAQGKIGLERLRQRIEELESERATKLEMVQMLDRLAKKLDSDKRQLEDDIENSKRRLQAELDQIRELISAAAHKWQEIAPNVGVNTQNRLQELWSPVLKKGQFNSKAAGDENARLEQTAQYLSDVGLRFDRRVLNAFHTSLKVGEMSPLVVLAGISGTGKSELPRRYAEGMGMHCLTLAVQPRWDSPQDMFGFYNYLENRYRATDLARALVQMDRYFDEKERGWNYPDDWQQHSLAERMLLVLLDEMNLARVEYYFSEFLSRLETRRGLDRDNAFERRKGEIMLEVGMQSLHRGTGEINVVDQPTLPLFVDTNVLFVGTMNEDESTQTLSDKVVDRANVLRFGRPAKLESRPTNGTVPKPSEAWLPYDAWKSWIRADDRLENSVREEVSEWGQTLNQAMHLIGRPFAHRTFASIVSYIANYPDPAEYKLAMADQIELKLLPKFRGLDPQENTVRQALSTVQNTLEQLGDEQLLDAVRQSLRNTEHQFVWQGVDRLERP